MTEFVQDLFSWSWFVFSDGWWVAKAALIFKVASQSQTFRIFILYMFLNLWYV